MARDGSHRPQDRNGHARRKLRAAVLASEDVCHLCGGLVDKSLRWPHPMSPEVDHVVPVSVGGHPYARSNARLAHRICNLRKGAGVNKPGLSEGLPTSQEW